MVFTKECNNAKHTSLLGRVEEIEDKYFSIEVLKHGSNRYLRSHIKLKINPSNPIIVE